LGSIRFKTKINKEVEWFGLNVKRYLFMTKEQNENERIKRPVLGVALGLSVMAEININAEAKKRGIEDKDDETN